jgi:hypothetical protein
LTIKSTSPATRSVQPVTAERTGLLFTPVDATSSRFGTPLTRRAAHKTCVLLMPVNIQLSKIKKANSVQLSTFS